MSLTLLQLQQRQSTINASEIAWIIQTFYDKTLIPWLPSYVQNKTLYQFYCEKIATLQQLEKIQKATKNRFMSEGSTRENELTTHLDKYFNIQLAQENLSHAILGATPDIYITAKEDALILLPKNDLNGVGVGEIKLTHENSQNNKKLIEYHSWQVQQQIIVTQRNYGILAIFHKQYGKIELQNISINYVAKDLDKQWIILQAAQKAFQWLNDIKNNNIDKPMAICEIKNKKHLDWTYALIMNIDL